MIVLIAIAIVLSFTLLGITLVHGPEQEEPALDYEPPRSYWLDVAYVGMTEMLGREPTVAEVWEATPPEWSEDQ